MMYSTVEHPAITVYPDSDKVGVWTGNKDDDAILIRSRRWSTSTARSRIRPVRGGGQGIAAGATLASACLALPGAAAAAKDDTVWLCKPGLADNPCKPGLATTQISPTGDVSARASRRRRSPKVDCFYVYPTVSDDQGRNSDLSIDPEERSIALYQAARYSQRCRVFAPMYRQITLAGAVQRPAGHRGGERARLRRRARAPGRPTCASTTTAAG